MRLVVDEKGHAGLPVGLDCVMKSRSALAILLLHIDVGLPEQLGHYPGLTLESCQMLYATTKSGSSFNKSNANGARTNGVQRDSNDSSFTSCSPACEVK